MEILRRESLWPATASREKVKGAIIHKAGSKIQHDWLYLQKLQ
jgi:hypothetical protein